MHVWDLTEESRIATDCMASPPGKLSIGETLDGIHMIAYTSMEEAENLIHTCICT